MKPDPFLPPLSPAQEREARLTALLLGELSPEEAVALRQTLAQDEASTEPSPSSSFTRISSRRRKR